MLEPTAQIDTSSFFPYDARVKILLSVKTVRLSDKQFERLCADNPNLKFELSAKEELIIVPPTGMESGEKNSELIYQFVKWARKDKRGKVFDSSTLFTFPNGAKRSPDVSWILNERIEKLSPAERKGFARIVPDFVLELLSPTDSLAETKAKMKEYIENGVRLGWLVDPQKKQVHIYRASGEIEILDDPGFIYGEDVLPNLKLKINEIF
jgi:Uma2 family endonuclease